MAFNLQNLQNKLETMQNSEQVSSSYMQFLQKAGFFISEETAKACSFTPDSQWKPHNHIFGASGEITSGYLCKSPRLLVVKKSELTIVSKEGRVLGAFSKQLYNKQLHSLKMRYVVIPVGTDGNPLVSEPIMLPVKGAFQVSFSATLAEQRKQAQSLIRVLTRKTYSPDSEIWGYFVFQPTFIDVDSGYNRNMVSKVNGFKEITEDNLEEMFLLENPAVESMVKVGMEMEVSYLKPQGESEALPLETMQPKLQQEQKDSLNKLTERFAGTESDDSEDSLY